MKGRKKTPAKVLQFRGNPGRRPINEQEPDFEIGLPDPPDFFNDTEKKWWNYHAPELIEKGILARVDIGIFMSLCSALAEFEISSKQLSKPAKYTHVNLNGGEKKSPWVMIRKDARDQIRSLGAELGLSACSRAKVQTKPKEKKAGAARFLA